MFEQILVPLDRSLLAESVLPHALAMAKALDARLLLLHVLARSDLHNGLRAVDPLEWHIRRAEAESYLQSIRERLQEHGVSAEPLVLDGDAAEQILAAAHEHGARFIVISSHGQSGLSSWNISSVVQKVIQRAQTSLLIVRAFQQEAAEIAPATYRRLLAPLDGSLRAESVLPLINALVRSCADEVLLAHVVERPTMPRRTPLSAEDSELAERIVERNRSEAAPYLETISNQLPTGKVDTRLVVAPATSASLHELVDRDEIDLVIFSAHGYSNQIWWPYGSLVTNFIVYGSTPLLIVQDASPDQIAPTHAQLALEKTGRR